MGCSTPYHVRYAAGILKTEVRRAVDDRRAVREPAEPANPAATVWGSAATMTSAEPGSRVSSMVSSTGLPGTTSQ